MRRFIAIWFGQVVSMIGSGITAFGIGVWLYTETGSVTLFALNAFLQFLPGILLGPISGLLADRFGRRRIMMLTDSGAALSTVFLALMFFTGHLSIGWVYLVTLANSLFGTFQSPAYSSAITMMIPKEQFTRASAMLSFASQVSALLIPISAGFLLGAIGLSGIMLIDFITFLIAILTLISNPFPELEKKVKIEFKSSLLSDAFEGWRYFMSEPALRSLLLLTGFNLFFIAWNATLSVPIMLNVMSIEVVGIMGMIFGFAGILGSTVMTIWGGSKKHRIKLILTAHFMIGCGLILFGLRPSAILMGVAGFIISFTLPLRDSSTDAVWRSKVPHEIQGRIYGVLQVVGSAAFGLAYLIIGPIADNIFEPLMASDGALSNIFGSILSVGAGRGLALCVVFAGILTITMTLMTTLNPKVRRIEIDVADIVAS